MRSREGRITGLTLSFKKITAIPSEIGNFSALKGISLSANKLSKLPSEFSKLRNLEYFSLDGNDFEEFPIIFRNLQFNKFRGVRFFKANIEINESNFVFFNFLKNCYKNFGFLYFFIINLLIVK